MTAEDEWTWLSSCESLNVPFGTLRMGSGRKEGKAKGKFPEKCEGSARLLRPEASKAASDSQILHFLSHIKYFFSIFLVFFY